MRTIPLLITQVVLAAGAGYLGYQAASQRAPEPPPTATAPSSVPGAQPAPAPSPAASPDAASTAATLSFRHAVERAAPSVVTVYSARRVVRGPLGRVEGVAQGLGSGVVIDSGGLVVTNYHVIQGSQLLAIALADGSVTEAKLVGVDPETDLALLRVADAELRPIEMGSTKQIAVGDIVLAVGNPLGVGQTVTQGIVSATGRRRLGINPIENFVQTDAAINPGNSGGALIDTQGRLIGINTVILSRGGGFEGIGLAIPVELARQVAASLARDGRVARGWLGVAAEDLPRGQQPGVLIQSVQPNGPAARAGIRPGDILSRLGEREINSSEDLLAATLEMEPGARVSAQIQRGRQQRTLPVELGRRPPLRQAGR
ncbi:MAG TPA: trypsin-like peptidase domain-containing protein [Burkholderiaceae bacterium]|nr:trypsin-like peptidase domain-containing protein [Burkholderiaceae bacterium]